MNSADPAAAWSSCAGTTLSSRLGWESAGSPLPARTTAADIGSSSAPAAVSGLPSLPSAFRPSSLAHVPLRVHSHYSFLDSTLSPAAIVELAKHHGLPAVALTDTGNLHGAVEFVQAAKQAGIKPILGAELRVGGKPLLLYVESARGYHNLCRLLSQEGRRGNAAMTKAASPPASALPLPRAFLLQNASLAGGVDRRQPGHPAGRDVSPPILRPRHRATNARRISGRRLSPHPLRHSR